MQTLYGGQVGPALVEPAIQVTQLVPDARQAGSAGCVDASQTEVRGALGIRVCGLNDDVGELGHLVRLIAGKVLRCIAELAFEDGDGLSVSPALR
ncbi:hypothetical protein ACIBF5_09150 [Micromonospora sp. NPDC050417]|uniref:hypothetical protein n=1 Tax=Micromonospora sp. NPDC050417 TaxID=3364280 RepID=UPI0037AF5F54